MLDKLNAEILIEIFKKLPKSDFSALSRVNKKCYEASHKSSLLLTKANFFKAAPAPLPPYIIMLDQLLTKCWTISEDAYYGGGHTRKSKQNLRENYTNFDDQLTILLQTNSNPVKQHIKDFLTKNEYYLSQIKNEIDWYSKDNDVRVRCRV